LDPEAVIALVSLVAVGGSIFALALRANRTWNKFAHRRGLVYSREGFGRPAHLSGTIPGVGPVEVRIDPVPGDDLGRNEATFRIGSELPTIADRLLHPHGGDLAADWTTTDGRLTRTTLIKDEVACERELDRGLALVRRINLLAALVDTDRGALSVKDPS
jgi:hypothetical protein